LEHLKSNLSFFGFDYLGIWDYLDHSRLLKMKLNSNSSLQIAQYREDLRITKEQHIEMLAAILHPIVVVMRIIVEMQGIEVKGDNLDGVDLLG